MLGPIQIASVLEEGAEMERGHWAAKVKAASPCLDGAIRFLTVLGEKYPYIQGCVSISRLGSLAQDRLRTIQITVLKQHPPKRTRDSGIAQLYGPSVGHLALFRVLQCVAQVEGRGGVSDLHPGTPGLLSSQIVAFAPEKNAKLAGPAP